MYVDKTMDTSSLQKLPVAVCCVSSDKWRCIIRSATHPVQFSISAAVVVCPFEILIWLSCCCTPFHGRRRRRLRRWQRERSAVSSSSSFIHATNTVAVVATAKQTHVRGQFRNGKFDFDFESVSEDERRFRIKFDMSSTTALSRRKRLISTYTVLLRSVYLWVKKCVKNVAYFVATPRVFASAVSTTFKSDFFNPQIYTAQYTCTYEYVYCLCPHSSKVAFVVITSDTSIN